MIRRWLRALHPRGWSRGVRNVGEWVRGLNPRRWSLGTRRVPGRRGILLIVLGAFVVGVGVAWFTAVLARAIVSGPVPSQSPSTSPSPTVDPSASQGPVVPVDQYPPITRDIDDADQYAGLTDLNIPLAGSGEYVVAPGVEPPETDGSVHWVRIEVEDSLPLTPEPLSVFILAVLNDDRGWTSTTHDAYGGTEGAADIRIIFANPSSADTLCDRPHEAAPPPFELHEDDDDTTSPSPSPSVSSSDVPEISPSCAEQGIIVVNAYEWAAGLAAFGDDRSAARDYLINHFMGHLLEKPDATCPSPDALAPVMLDHELPVEPCRPNPWPNPIVS